MPHATLASQAVAPPPLPPQLLLVPLPLLLPRLLLPGMMKWKGATSASNVRSHGVCGFLGSTTAICEGGGGRQRVGRGKRPHYCGTREQCSIVLPCSAATRHASSFQVVADLEGAVHEAARRLQVSAAVILHREQEAQWGSRMARAHRAVGQRRWGQAAPTAAVALDSTLLHTRYLLPRSPGSSLLA